MHVFPDTAGLGAVNTALVWQEGAAQERALTLGTAEAALGGVPVETIVGHLSVIDTWKLSRWLVVLLQHLENHDKCFI